jgi:hypothetical protein
MYDLALMLAETRNWFEPFRRYEPFQAKFWHAASENRPISKEQYRCWRSASPDAAWWWAGVLT